MVNQSWPAASPESCDRKDVRVLQPGGELDLALEALGAQRAREIGVEHLERDRPVVPQILGEEDGGHAAPPELALEGVRRGKRRLRPASGGPSPHPYVLR